MVYPLHGYIFCDKDMRDLLSNSSPSNTARDDYNGSTIYGNYKISRHHIGILIITSTLSIKTISAIPLVPGSETH